MRGVSDSCMTLDGKIVKAMGLDTGSIQIIIDPQSAEL